MQDAQYHVLGKPFDPKTVFASKQSTFEYVVKHLFEQGEQSRDTEGCLYRHKNKNKLLACGVGCIIPDELYNIVIDRGYNYINNILRRRSKYLEDFRTFIKNNITFKNKIVFLTSLQKLHDRDYPWANTQSMREHAILIGSELKLNTDFISGLSFKNK